MPDLSHEIKWGRDKGATICGVDEVGRGPLAGPVIAAAVILPDSVDESLAARINDSKKISAKRRDALYPELIAHCPYALGEASVEEIDRLNILQATFLAMRRAIESLEKNFSLTLTHVLIDGNRVPPLHRPATALVKGDSLSLSIAAASIIAKVTRDRLMTRLALDHPFYGWADNAGYGTEAHLEALATYGITEHHRRTFSPIKDRAL